MEIKDFPLPKFKYGIAIFSDVSKFDFDSIEFKENTDLTIKKTDQLEESTGKIDFSPKDKIDALHVAGSNVKILEIPDNTSLESPIELNLVLTQNRADHLIIKIGKNSKATILDKAISKKDKPIFRSQRVKIVAEENAKVIYVTLQQFNNNVYNFCEKNADLKQNANVYWLECSLGSGFTKSYTTSNLLNNGANSKNFGIFFGKNDQQFDFHHQAHHKAENTHSQMCTKGILKDTAKTIYRGLIKINEDAKNCSSTQKEDTILLSDDAEIDAVPNLEIHTQDVKECSHGTSIGNIDEEMLFYLMARGLSEQEAKGMIIEGFLESLLKEIKNEEIEEQLKTEIKKELTC